MGYYIVYGFFYGISLLPWFIIYGISDIIFLLMAYVFRYRRDIILESLAKSFPEKTEKERRQILRSFYRNFSQTWMEMIKLLSISDSTLKRMVSVDFSAFHELTKDYPHVQLFAGHFMNWELYQAVLPANVPYLLKGIYMPLSSKIFERLVHKIRNRFGTVLIAATNKESLQQLNPLPGTSFCTAVVADQSPPNLHNAYWLKFMQQPTAFLGSPWVRMQRLNQPVVYIHCKKIRRGRYALHAQTLFLAPAALTPEQMTLQYAKAVEQTILENPPIYLWSHRRWKIAYDPANPGAPWIGDR